MKHSEVKVGQKVKFNGVINRKRISGEFENNWNESNGAMQNEYDGYRTTELTVEWVGCSGIKFEGLDFWYPASSIDESTTPNPYCISKHKLELLKALIEGKIIQYKSIFADKWIDCGFVLDALDSKQDDELRVKPPEPVVTTLIKGVLEDGYVTEARCNTMEELEKYYWDVDNFVLFIKQTFHDGVVVNVETIKN